MQRRANIKVEEAIEDDRTDRRCHKNIFNNRFKAKEGP